MIFVSTGSRKFQFDRLIKKIDELVANGDITDEVFAQIAETQYIPKHYSYTRYLSAKDFQKYQNKANIIISHAGAGALIGALKKEKQVIAVPRYFKLGEHSSDHQLEIAEVLASEGYLRQVLDINDLGMVIQQCYHDPILKKYDKPSSIPEIIIDFIENCK